MARSSDVFVSFQGLDHPSLALNKASLAFILWPSTEPSDGDCDNAPNAAGCTAFSPAQVLRPGRLRLRVCTIEGCTKRAKYRKRCWRHGGSAECSVLDCVRRAKTRGLCWAHGGGTVCSVGLCTTIAVSRGVCWAHGGGKRCLIPDCIKPAYGSRDNLCKAHYKQK